MSATTSTTQHVFRQHSSLGLAAVFALTGLFLLLSLARSWAAEPQPLFAAWVLLVLAFVWSIFVRPAVLLDVEGVTIRNVLRDVRIPWAQITDVEFRWNLKVFAGERAYTAWAISSQVERPRGASGGMLVVLPGRLDSYSGAIPQSSTPTPKVTASNVARVIEAAKQEYDEAVAEGLLVATAGDRVRITWVPLVLVVLLLPTIAVVLLSLI